MNEQIQRQLTLDAIAKWTEQCDLQLALLRYQLLAERLQQKKAA